jgi:hypothetical protein
MEMDLGRQDLDMLFMNKNDIHDTLQKDLLNFESLLQII